MKNLLSESFIASMSICKILRIEKLEIKVNKC